MSMENGVDVPKSPQEVVDEDGDVDKAIKRRIVKARERVDETEMALFRDEELNPDVDLSPAKKVQVYAVTVQQFLRRIEPLFRVDGIESNKHYYKEIEIYKDKIYPPDWEGYRFSLVKRRDEMADENLRRMIGLPKGVDIPEPIRVSINGLEEIIEREPFIQHQWEVCVSKGGAPPNWEFVYPQIAEALPRDVYINAVRRADMFLQEAGIGLDTDTKGTEVIRNFDMSGEEPEAEYGVGDYDSNPDL